MAYDLPPADRYPQVVLIATPERIETMNWDKDVEIMDGHSFNIGTYLAGKGITVI